LADVISFYGIRGDQLLKAMALSVSRNTPAAHFDRKLDRGLDLFQQWPGFLQTFSIGIWAFAAVLQQLAGFGVDTDFVCHAAILDIEGVA
jgi:hypothetical protein